MKRAMSSNNIASQDIPTAAESAAKRTRKDSKGNSRSKGTTSRPVRTLSQATADQDKSPAGPSSIDPPEDNEVLSLRSEVAMLKQTVSQLSSRLNFVLSLLGVPVHRLMFSVLMMRNSQVCSSRCQPPQS